MTKERTRSGTRGRSVLAGDEQVLKQLSLEELATLLADEVTQAELMDVAKLLPELMERVLGASGTAVPRNEPGRGSPAAARERDLRAAAAGQQKRTWRIEPRTCR